jgi:hypothetical protein
MRKDENSALPGATGELGAVVIRAGGERRDLGLIS